MMSDATEFLTDELVQQVKALAVAQNRKPVEVLQEAVAQYAQKQSWREFVNRNEKRAAALGLTEDDVPRLVQEVRREKREHGR
jgi:predicted transcriptional regulator